MGLAQCLMHGGRIGEGAERPHLLVALAGAVTHVIRLIGLERGAALVADHFQVHLAHAALAQVKLLGCGIGEVDDPAAHIGAAVRHTDHDALAVVLIRDFDHRADGQGAVGRGKGVHVVIDTAGRGTAVKIAAVPGGLARKHFAALGALEPDFAAVRALADFLGLALLFVFGAAAVFFARAFVLAADSLAFTR